MKNSNQEVLDRIKKLLLILWLFVAGIIYLVWVRLTDIRIPCIFYIITNKYCPGCGITRMIVALSKLDFKAAFEHNALVFLLTPFLIVIFVQKIISYIKTGKTKDSLSIKIFYIIAFVLSLAFWILRNLQNFTWLAP